MHFLTSAEYSILNVVLLLLVLHKVYPHLYDHLKLCNFFFLYSNKLIIMSQVCKQTVSRVSFPPYLSL